MKLKMLTVGSLFTNCYVVWCSHSRQAIVIDPGFDREKDARKVLRFIKSDGLKVVSIVNTHGHSDHACGNMIVKAETNALILIHEFDANMLDGMEKRLPFTLGTEHQASSADVLLRDGDLVRFGKAILRVLHTPGHTHGSISLVGSNCVFTGDTLFAGSIGRVDLPGGSAEEMFHSLREKIVVLPDAFTAYPGHGTVSTIGQEKRSNPFLQENSGGWFLR
ncbi:MAG: MBL fold metallo-hydrolase [Candidatus Bathyarchaeota archaeon]|jgi:glyoxylase-like metal-dependent hydrolase (beta-lactamase superfamily II)|nr:MAG: MBL fold metallo-hydrolase [Candidatus Bathyarchaeota archaeon]